jgi:hypothetical protein
MNGETFLWCELCLSILASATYQALAGVPSVSFETMFLLQKIWLQEIMKISFRYLSHISLEVFLLNA